MTFFCVFDIIKVGIYTLRFTGVIFLKRMIFTVAVVNAVLNFMVIGIFMPPEVITLYGLTGAALMWGSKWFFGIYAAVPLMISGIFMLFDKSEYDEDENSSALDDFLAGKSERAENTDILLTWIFAVISWVMTGLALNNIENIGVIMPSIIVVMLSVFVLFTSSLYSGSDVCRICGINAAWLADCPDAVKRSHRLATLTGIMSGMIGVCLAAWSLVVNNNLPNCIAVAVLLIAAFIVPLAYSKSLAKKAKAK